jgi:hypothetical protein
MSYGLLRILTWPKRISPITHRTHGLPNLPHVEPFVAAERFYGFECTFWSPARFEVEDVLLTEGQCIRWWNREAIRVLPLGYEDNDIIEAFFAEHPWLETPHSPSQQRTPGSSQEHHPTE